MTMIFFRLLPVVTILLAFITPHNCFAGKEHASADSLPQAVVSSDANSPTIQVRQEKTGKIIEVPLFSGEYADLPVATVNDEPIPLKAFVAELSSMHSDISDDESSHSHNQNFKYLLNRLIAIKLVKQEALNIGFDRTPEVQKKVDKYALKMLIKQLLTRQIVNLQTDPEAVDELYQQMAVEVKLLVYRFDNKADGQALLAEVQDGADFDELAAQMVADGKAKGDKETDYTRLTDLLPNVAKAAYGMTTGQVSQIYQSDKGFFIFRMEGRQIYEDVTVRQEAQKRVLQDAAQKRQMEYLNELIDKFATFDDAVLADLDYKNMAAENPNMTKADVLTQMEADQRPVVTLTNNKEVATITVADIGQSLRSSLFHGVEGKIDANQMNKLTSDYIKDSLTALTGRMEAEQQDIHNSKAYQEMVAKYEEQVLFDTFMSKAVLPGLVVPEEDVRKYYYNHLEDYSSPMMLTMKSLVFTDHKSAADAVKKLKSGSDFKWVSANVTGLAEVDNPEMLNFGDSLLAETALPEDLQKKLVGAKVGDLHLYPGPGDLYYALVINSVFPPEAEPYEKAREEAGRIVYGQKIEEAFEEWVRRLKEAYETKIFIVQ